MRAIDHPDYGTHHLVAYNNKLVSMSYIANVKDQFKFAGMRVIDNGAPSGVIITPKREVFRVTQGSRKAVRLDATECERILSAVVPA